MLVNTPSYYNEIVKVLCLKINFRFTNVKILLVDFDFQGRKATRAGIFAPDAGQKPA